MSARRVTAFTSNLNSLATGAGDHASLGSSTRQVIMAGGLIALAAGLTVNSFAGPLLIDAIDYPVSASMRNQTIGLDAAALFLFAPACFITALLAWRGHRLAPIEGLRRGAPWSRLALTAAVGWFALVNTAVGAMSLTMVLNNDPDASRAQLGVFVIATAAVGGYAIYLHRALLDEPRPSGDQHAVLSQTGRLS